MDAEHDRRQFHDNRNEQEGSDHRRQARVPDRVQPPSYAPARIVHGYPDILAKPDTERRADIRPTSTGYPPLLND
jgi:hypothetical protein